MTNVNIIVQLAAECHPRSHRTRIVESDGQRHSNKTIFPDSIVNHKTGSRLNSLNLAGGVLLVGSGFLVVFSPVQLVLPWGLIYVALLLLATLSLVLGTHKTRHDNIIAVSMISVLIVVIVFAAMAAASAQVGPMAVP